MDAALHHFQHDSNIGPPINLSTYDDNHKMQYSNSINNLDRLSHQFNTPGSKSMQINGQNCNQNSIIKPSNIPNINDSNSILDQKISESCFSSPLSLSNSIAPSPTSFVMRVNLVEQNMKKSIRCERSHTVWSCKKRIINNLTKQLKHESFNYGLLSPLKSSFLSDHLEIGQVLPDRPIHDVEMKLKCRVHFNNNTSKRKHNNLDNRSKFMNFIRNGNLASLKKELLDKNFDPNFIADESLNLSGQTPLTLTTYLKENVHETLVTLLTNGAILDFRNKLGHSALHVAVRNHNIVAVNVFLKHDPQYWKCLDTISRPALFYLCPKPTLAEHYGVQENEINANTEDSKSVLSSEKNRRSSSGGGIRSASFSSSSSGHTSIGKSTNGGSASQSSSIHHTKNNYKYFTLTKKKELNLQQQRLTNYSSDLKYNHPKTIESANKILEILYRASKYSIGFFKFQDERGWTVWHHIAYHNNDDFLLKILEQAETFGNIACIDGNNLFFNQPSTLTGNVPLHTAAVHNSTLVAKYLIEMMNCKINVKNLAGKVPLDYCYGNSGTITLSPIGRFIDALPKERQLDSEQALEHEIHINENELSGLAPTNHRNIKKLQNSGRTFSQESDNSNKENSLPTVASSGYYSDIIATGSAISPNLAVSTVTVPPLGKLSSKGHQSPKQKFSENGIYVAVREYKGKSKEELTLLKGDRVEVIASPEGSSYWEGKNSGNCGWFPRLWGGSLPKTLSKY